MNRINKLMFIFLVVISGCSKDSNPVSGNGESQIAFIIDTMKFSAIVKPDSNGYLSTHIPFRIVYHFQGLSGSLDYLSLSSSGYGYLYEATPIIRPVGVRQVMSSDFVGGDALVGQDSLLLHMKLFGRFWTEADTAYAAFSVTDSLNLLIQR